MELLFEMSRAGRTAGTIPASDVPEVTLDKIIDASLLREDLIFRNWPRWISFATTLGSQGATSGSTWASTPWAPVR